MASSSSSSSSAAYRDWDADASTVELLKRKRTELGNDAKFRAVCNVTDSDGLKLLHTAAELADLDLCKFLVQEMEVDIDAKSEMGETALIIALNGDKKDHMHVAVYLIVNGADVTITDTKLFTPLHYAILKGNESVIILLLKKGADIDADSTGGTPLHCAAKTGKVNLVKVLLRLKAKPNLVSKLLGVAPLISAICSSSNVVECVELLLKAGADPNKIGLGLSPLAHALEGKVNSCIGSLLKAGADVDIVSSCGMTPIEHAAFEGNLDGITKLIHLRPRLMARPGWNLREMVLSIKTVDSIEKREEYLRSLKQKGDDAYNDDDYTSAAAFYTEILHHNHKDRAAMANRELCWTRLGEDEFALHDADICAWLKPRWDKARLRAAIAYHRLKCYRLASEQFKKVYDLTDELQLEK